MYRGKRWTLLALAAVMLGVFVLAAPVMAATGSLATNLTTNGGAEGAFFDVTALQEDIYITHFETTLVGTANVRVYYKAGTYVGSENNAAAWTLLGSHTMTGGNGFIQTLYDVPIGGVTIPAGQTYGFLIYSGFIGTGSHAIRMRIGATSTVANSDIAIYSGNSSHGGDLFTPFDGPLSVGDAWRGVVYYDNVPPSGCGGDGRINPQSCAGPVALYCDGDTLKVYAIDPISGEGSLAFTYSEWPAEAPAANSLLASLGAVELWHLTTGEFQVNARPAEDGKIYAFVFNGCPYGGGGYNANLDPNE